MNQTVVFGHPILHKEVVEKIDAVTIDDVKRLASKILQSVTSVVTVGKRDCSDVVEAFRTNGFKA